MVVYTGELESLKRLKDDVREVKEGFECGIKLKNYNDIDEGRPAGVLRDQGSRPNAVDGGAPRREPEAPPRQTAGFLFEEQPQHRCATRRSHPNRSFRVADQIQRDVAELIRELKDPRIGMVTINAVEVTPDYAHAKVFFSLLVGDPAECEAALNEAAGFLRNGLFKRLQIHTVPTLHFQFDRTTERAAELSRADPARPTPTRAKDD